MLYAHGVSNGSGGAELEGRGGTPNRWPGAAVGAEASWLSWQVVPAGIEELFTDSDRERARRAMQAMLRMRKLDIEALRSAADGVAAA